MFINSRKKRLNLLFNLCTFKGRQGHKGTRDYIEYLMRIPDKPPVINYHIIGMEVYFNSREHNLSGIRFNPIFNLFPSILVSFASEVLLWFDNRDFITLDMTVSEVIEIYNAEIRTPKNPVNTEPTPMEFVDMAKAVANLKK